MPAARRVRGARADAAPARRRARRLAPSLLLGALLLAVSGCATYSDSFRPIEQQLQAQRYDLALQELERKPHPDRDEVLYLLNRGMLTRMNRDLEASNQALEAAKQRMEALYAASVSEHALAFVINDATLSYAGEEYEQVLVRVYKALNYLEQGQPDAARVEALQIDIKLREIAERLPENRYAGDAFARYLTGLVYEELGEWSDALIAYRKAYEAYRTYRRNNAGEPPSQLKQDLLRLTSRQGLRDELAKYRKEFAIDRWMSLEELGQGGELVFLLHNGLAPIKREHAVTVVNPNSGHLIRVSLPYYQTRAPAVTAARLNLGGSAATTEPAEDVQAMAVESLNAKMPVITARAVARAAVKQEVARKAGGRDNRDQQASLAPALLSLTVEVAGLLTERADTRSWLTLPHDIQLVRLPLPPGEYTVNVELLGPHRQAIETRTLPRVTIRKGHKTFVSQHVVSP
ncbi:MAG: hypothetical protein A2151_03185 [Candidatus Muproteobacteria bacterium RBG_16_65_34]|uniref:Uncharacterized protein n=1 Tax=Candidatus Muproteobacteria bacterium RBG_16_65_34 TaxID=1817760 RepID=A0A1F6TR87_9PROT|nr:MAG: hypothetical protein A2151_03185 [Candidatus Muproteobacteria bacterium RBG_16_65_34]